jgi:hypothetical protein
VIEKENKESTDSWL